MKKKFWQYFLLLSSFLLPLIILSLIWAQLGLAPFGNQNLLVSDLGSQYLPFLSLFKETFSTGSFSWYSFSNGLGDGILPLVAYYSVSPFNLLALCFSFEQLPVAILLIITLKIASMGTTMFIYLKKQTQQLEPLALLFSTAYSLCGFVTIYCLNFMWLDALIFFPLLVLGLERLYHTKRWGLYSSMLFLTIVTNYYLGYMVCLFSVIYFLYLYFSEHALRPLKWRQFWKNSRLFWLSSLLTGMSTAFLLVPAILGMFSTKKASMNGLAFLPYPRFELSFFSQFGIGNVNFDLRLDHLPTVFSGVFVLLLVGGYFLLPTISKRQKKLSGFLLVAIFLSFWINSLHTVWHMFQQPAGFPYRNTFIFSFLLLRFGYTALLSYRKDLTIPLILPIYSSLALIIGYLCLWLFWPSLFSSFMYLGLSLLSLWGCFALLRIGFTSQKTTKTICAVLLVLLVSGELGFNFWTTIKTVPFGNQTKFAEMYKQQQQLLKEIDTHTGDIVRVKQTIDSEQAGYSEKNNGYNNSFLYHYAGISSYTSTLNADTQESLHKLGLFEKNDRRIAYVDNSQVLNLLLNVGYTIQAEDPETGTETPTIMRNSEANGLSFFVAPTAKDIQWQDKHPVENQELLLQTLKPQIDSYFQAATYQQWQAVDKNHWLLEATTTASGDVHFYLPDLKGSTIESFKVNGVVQKPAVNIVTNQLYNLGHYPAETTLKIEIKTSMNLADKSTTIASLDEAAFQTVVEQIKNDALVIHRKNDGYLTGSYNKTTADQQLIYFAIPYDQDWQVLVDGKEVPTMRILDNFIGIDAVQGEHQLTLRYRPRSAYLGFGISLVSLLLALILILIRKRQGATRNV